MTTQAPMPVDTLYQTYDKTLYRTQGSDPNSLMNQLQSSSSANNSQNVETNVADLGSGGATASMGGGAQPQIQAFTAENVDIVTTLTAGELIDVPGRPLYMSGGVEDHFVNIANGLAASEAITATTWKAQSFLSGINDTKLTKITLNFKNYVALDVITIKIRSVITGPDLFSSTFSSGSSSANVLLNFIINLTISPNTTYFVVVSYAVTSGTPALGGSASDIYPSGQGFTSADSGVTWSSSATVLDFYLQVKVVYTTAGLVYLATSIDGDNKMYNFVGFSYQAASAGGQVQVQVGGRLTRTSALNVGQTYWISTTAGVITNAQPTNTYRVGVSVSTTDLIIMHDSNL